MSVCESLFKSCEIYCALWSSSLVGFSNMALTLSDLLCFVCWMDTLGRLASELLSSSDAALKLHAANEAKHDKRLMT